jgi:hypothetical protein
LASSHSKTAPGLWRIVYKTTSWLTLASLIVAIVMVLRKSPPPHAKVDPQAAARAQAKLDVPKPAPGSGAPQQLHLDEAELNSYLRQNLTLLPPSVPSKSVERATPGDPALEEVQSSVKDFEIALEGDRAKAYVIFDLHGVDLSLLLEGRLRVENGYLRFEPTSGRLGSLPLSQSTLEAGVGQLLDSPENKEKFRVPPEIRDIHVENSELVVTYR